jgi:hypothetical protein
MSQPRGAYGDMRPTYTVAPTWNPGTGEGYQVKKRSMNKP